MTASKTSPHVEHGEGKPGLRIAIIGAGITGISAACHILGLGFECHIFEAGSAIGGIWPRVNRFSSLQIPSDFYRFHPEVDWKSPYPRQAEILGQIHALWNRYELEKRTTFGCRVQGLYRREQRWVVEDERYGTFDGVICAIGTCAGPYAPYVAGKDGFEGEVRHSSSLDGLVVRDKRVVIIGAGASAAEALEYACDNGAASVKVCARSNRWIIPRWRLLNLIMAMLIVDPLGLCDSAFEYFLRFFCYRSDLRHLAPSGERSMVYSKTPVVNSRMFELLREKHVTWMNCRVNRFDSDGVEYVPHAATDECLPKPVFEKCDICIKATGYYRPSLELLSPHANGYTAPNFYLQVFPPGNPTILALNSTWVDGIGSVGASHIGIYVRLLLVYLVDASAQPDIDGMKNWIHWMGRGWNSAKGLEFVTTMQLYLWFILTILFRWRLWRWGRFILFGNERVIHR